MVFIAPLNKIAELNQLSCLIRHHWIIKMCYIYTKEYYIAVRNDTSVQIAATWMELEDVLNEVIQKMVKYEMISLRYGI